MQILSYCRDVEMDNSAHGFEATQNNIYYKVIYSQGLGSLPENVTASQRS
jgi:hypothetical protein